MQCYCIEDLYFSWKQRFKVKNTIMMNLLPTNTQFFLLQDVYWCTHQHLEQPEREKFSANVNFWMNNYFNYGGRRCFEIICMLSVDLDSYHLKERLSENEDFVLVPAEAWHKLMSWYDMMDNQPPLERKVVLTRLLTFFFLLKLNEMLSSK